MLDIEQGLVQRLVAAHERLPRAVSLAEHAVAAEQLERVGKRLALVAALEVDGRLELGAEPRGLAREAPISA